MKRQLRAAGAAVLFVSIPALALAQSLSAAPAGGIAEAAAALHYFELAYKTDNLDSARTDLREAINCLVGQGNKSYSATVQSRCTGRGKGAIRDVKDASLSQQLQFALGEASLGLKEVEITNVRMETLSAMDYMKWVRVDNSAFAPANDAATPSHTVAHPVVKLRPGEVEVSLLQNALVRNREGELLGAVVDLVLDTETHAVRIVGIKPDGHDSNVLAIHWSALRLFPALQPNSGYVSAMGTDAVATAPPFVDEARARPAFIDIERNFIGRPVLAADGQDIGKLVDLVIELRSGIVDYVLVSENSVNDAAQSPLALRWKAIADLLTQQDIVLTFDKRHLAVSPIFRAE